MKGDVISKWELRKLAVLVFDAQKWGSPNESASYQEPFCKIGVDTRIDSGPNAGYHVLVSEKVTVNELANIISALRAARETLAEAEYRYHSFRNAEAEARAVAGRRARNRKREKRDADCEASGDDE